MADASHPESEASEVTVSDLVLARKPEKRVRYCDIGSFVHFRDIWGKVTEDCRKELEACGESSPEAPLLQNSVSPKGFPISTS